MSQNENDEDAKIEEDNEDNERTLYDVRVGAEIPSLAGSANGAQSNTTTLSHRPSINSDVEHG